MRPISTGEFSAMVGDIYDCAIDPGLWPGTLAMLRTRLGFANASMDLFALPDGRHLLNVSEGLDPAWQAALPEYASDALEQWGGMDRIQGYPLDEPLLLSLVNPVGRTRANRYWAEIAEPRGMVDVVLIGLARDSASAGGLAFGRHRDFGPVGETEIGALGLFIPHLKRAVTISRLLEARAVERANFAGVLDGLSVAVLLVGSDLRLLHANRAGEALLRATDPFGTRAGRVTAPASVKAAIMVALAAEPSALGRRGLGIPARRGDGEALVVHLLPLRNASPVPEAAAALFVTAAASPPPAPLDAIAGLFDLTPAETRVLDLIVRGASRAEAAKTLGIAASTVQTHLLRVFAKTGARRQVDLVGLVAGFALPVA